MIRATSDLPSPSQLQAGMSESQYPGIRLLIELERLCERTAMVSLLKSESDFGPRVGVHVFEAGVGVGVRSSKLSNLGFGVSQQIRTYNLWLWGIIVFWPVPNHTALWQRYMCEQLAQCRYVVMKRPGVDTCDLLIGSPRSLPLRYHGGTSLYWKACIFAELFYCIVCSRLFSHQRCFVMEVMGRHCGWARYSFFSSFL